MRPDLDKTKHSLIDRSDETARFHNEILLRLPDNDNNIFLDLERRIRPDKVERFPRRSNLRRCPRTLSISSNEWKSRISSIAYRVNLVQSFPLFFRCVDFRCCLNRSLHLTGPND